MAKQALPANRSRIWAFAQSYDFFIVSTDHVLNADNFNPGRQQKNQIVLHGTAGNGSAEQVIDWWNDPASAQSSAHFIVERTHTAQAARPAPAGADHLDTGLVDCVRVLDDEVRSFHGGNVNPISIGIELVNVAWGWFASSAADEPTLAGRHVPLGTCPAPINISTVANPIWRCNHARPQDPNRFIRLPAPIGGHTDYQAYQDEQYKIIILLLRHLCIRHRIPRQFLGTSRAAVFRHYETDGNAVERRVFTNILHRFRGIYAHRNAHANKVCPGILNRNRLYRGIIDEWWLPIQPDGVPRPYYSGPFANPPWAAAAPARPSHFRFTAAGRIEGVVYRDADLDALIETKSYYDTDQVNSYYGLTETRWGGTFPVGINKVWHGGVHLVPLPGNHCVHAAASGTIVAARLSSNPDTDGHPKFGSQRFVLVRHAVYRELEADPSGLGQRINYAANPVYVFSLYMHLASVADVAAENPANPPWFNLWRRANPGVDIGMDGEKGRVFAPEIEVSVGDILGLAGLFRGRTLLHFEILTHRNAELRGAPWSDARKRVEDTNANLICDVNALDRFVTDRFRDGIDIIDALRAAPELRDVKAMHKSEWALSSEEQIAALVPHSERRRVLWPHFQRCSWVSEAVAANARLGRELGDANGMFWHYHPITFMQHINELVLRENREVRESEDHDTNVEIDEDYFLTNFVQWAPAPGPGHFAADNVDGHPVHPTDVSAGAQQFSFSRRDVSCLQAGAHNPGPTPAQSTRFSLALLEILESIRRRYGASMQVTLSYACSAHGFNNALCILNNAGAMASHRDGVAVDFHPAVQNPANCRNLWNSTVDIVNGFNAQYAHLCGTPTQGNFPAGFQGIRYQTTPAAQVKFTAVPQQNLNAAEAGSFRIHLELTPLPAPGPGADPASLPVRLRVTFESISVLDDQDWFGAGEWNIQANVNGNRVGIWSNRKVNSGETIALDGGWNKTLTLAGDGALEIKLSGYDEDVFWDDSLGSVSLRYSSASSPSWGLGRQVATSSNSSFRVTFNIESMNLED